MFSKQLISKGLFITKQNTLNHNKNLIYQSFKQYKKHHTPWPKPPNFYKNRSNLLLTHAGIWALVFGLCYSLVPLYRAFCQMVGIEGDLEKKDYSQKPQKNIFRKFRVRFKAEVDPELGWDFEPVQNEVIVGPGETALMFYKAVNRQDKPVVGFSTYEVFPEDATLYFSKIQCFCFYQQLLNPQEELQLPLYFYFEPEIVDDKFLENKDTITILYKFIQAKKQDLAKLAEEELQRVERNKKFIKEIRRQKKLKSGLDENEELENEEKELEIENNENEKNTNKNNNLQQSSI